MAVLLDTVRVSDEVVPPPGVGEVTAILIVPAVVISLERIVTVSVVLFTNTGVLSTPLISTLEALLKLVPVIVSVKLPPPGV